MQTIDVNETRRLLKEGVPVLDVLTPDSYIEHHIPGAKSAPVDAADFRERVEEAVPDRSATVVVYCASTRCQASPRAAQKLEEWGYTDVRDFEAGLAGWREAGFALTGEPTQVRADL